MNATRVAAIVAVAIVSTACSITMQFGEQGHVTLGPPARNAPVAVLINEAVPPPNGISVSPDPVYPTPTGGRMHLKWTLQSGSPYTFPPNGIVIHAFTPGAAGPKDLKCTPGPKVVNCNYEAPAAGTKYKYDVNVVGPGGARRLDPTIMN